MPEHFKRIAVVLSKAQREHVAWASDPMSDFWAAHEDREDHPRNNVTDPVQVTPLGAYIAARSDVIADLKYRLTVQLLDMGSHLTGGERGAWMSSCAAAKRAFDKIEAACRPHVVDPLYITCTRCGEFRRRDSSCECQLAEAERYYGVQ